MHRGALYVTDLNSCYSYTRSGEGIARIAQVERSALGLTMEQVESAAHLRASPFYDLLRGHIATLCTTAPTLAAHDRTSPAPITANLASTLLRTTVSTDDRTSRDAANGYLVDRAALFMRKNFSRPRAHGRGDRR
ncbi:hypothetical protein [Streptomyces rhizosphaerihabitans]|uniref:hypothetical protein n=1 Tax=Streptomyces rhizosphaerihabitans TaxID=1266770 RepID=UPI0021C13DDC|nr:hypothetical protein [Streptomyces rhizosphaerihabitans]MCT9011546.1 hypothetical protein [Streptomyces rhizosphaerihabitans]